MLTQQANHFKRIIKKQGFEGFMEHLTPTERHRIFSGHPDIIGQDMQVAGEDGIVRTQRMINWASLDERAAFDKLKKAGRL